jgi:hypothetical protein
VKCDVCWCASDKSILSQCSPNTKEHFYVSHDHEWNCIQTLRKFERVTVSWHKYVSPIFILQEITVIILYKHMKDTSLLYQIVSCSSVSRYNIEHIYYLKNHFIIFLFGCNKKKLCCVLSSGWFTGICSLNTNVSEHSVPSSQIS